jgi:maleylpyruvate isomerase
MRAIDVPFYVTAVAEASERVLSTADGLDDAAVALPSTLPGWNRAMVLTHLARNADGAAGVLAGARRGEAVLLYPHGQEGRAADIEAGRDRGASALLADLHMSVDGLAASYAAMREADWMFESRWQAGTFPVWQLLPSRWREVEVHHLDLALGYGPTDWPDSFVRSELTEAVTELPSRLPHGTSVRLVASDGPGEWRAGDTGSQRVVVAAPACELLAWLFGRPSSVVDAPEIASWH